MDYPRWNQPPIDLCGFVSHFVDLGWRLAHPESLCQLDGEGGHVERHHIGDAIKAGRPYHSLLCSPGAVQNDGTCLSYASSALQGTCWIRESYSIPLEHSWSTTQTPKWREFLHKLLVSPDSGSVFFRAYICLTFLDMIFTLVKCCSGTPTPPLSKPCHIQGDMDLVLAAVQQEGMALEYASPELQVRNSIMR